MGKISGGEWILIILIIGLSIIDLFANSISLIPGFGSIFESISETIIELLQIVFVILMARISKE